MSTYIISPQASSSAPALLFENVSYSVDKRSLFSVPPCTNKRKVIIENCSGVIRQGEIVAILGASGAGKSTLLDVLAKRKTYGNISGTVLYNGKEIKASHLSTNIAGYVRQDDYHLPQLTVRQTLNYAADLRCRTSREKKREKVGYLLKALSLELAQHNKVGDKERRGISGGEARRLSIGMEMLNDPDLLFLDEPTSGLDSASAKNVVLLMRRLVRTRKNAALCTIHQPSREVFEYFDKVILLAKSEKGIGTIAYMGPVLGVTPYFTRLGYPPRSLKSNPADHIIQLCSFKRDPSMAMEDEEEEQNIKKARSATASKLGMTINNDDDEEEKVAKSGTNDNTTVKVQEMIDSYRSSNELTDLMSEIEQSKSAPQSERETTWKPLPFIYQVTVLIRRSYQSIANDQATLIGKIVVLLFLGIIISSAYWQLSYDSQDIQNRISLIFFMLLSCFFAAEPFFGYVPRERVLVNHERGAKLYGPVAYFISTTIAAIPIQLFICQGYVTAVYWCSGLRDSFVYYAIFIIEYSLLVIVMVYYALSMGAFSPNVEAALGLSAIIFTIMMLFNGFFLLEPSIPPWWIWANWASPLKYALTVGLVNEFADKKFDDCNSDTDYCSFKDGNTLLDFYGADPSLKWPYIAVTGGFALVFATIFFVSVRYCRYEKR